MALSSELINRLDRDDEPISKRLKLAENAYCSAELAITRKEDLIVKWLCKIAPLHFVAWKTLNLCIECQRSNNKNALNNEAKRQLIQTLEDKLKLVEENVIEEVVLDCCNWVILNPGMQLYFQSILHIYGRFLGSILVRIKLDSLKSSSADGKTAFKLSDTELACVTNCVESLVQMHKQHSQKDLVAGAFLDYVLSPLCALIDPACSDSTNRIGAEAYKCMQQVLFGKSRQAKYEEYSQGKERIQLPTKLFTTLDRLVKDAETDHVCVMLSYLFRAATNSYKSNGTLVDYFFRRLVDFVSKYRTEVANSLVVYLADVNLQFDNKIDDITLTQYLENLIDDTLRRKKFTSGDYRLLCNIAGLNPLIIENKLSAIFKRILLESRSSESERQSYVTLMISVLDASSRLRREQKLIPWLLLALQAALTEDKDCQHSAKTIFPLEFNKKFTALVGSLQNSQLPSMLKSLIFHLKSYCVDEYGEIPLLAECTVQLLISFFNGIRIYEYSVPPAMQKKFASVLGELGTVLANVKEKILKTKQNERITIVLLEAALSWSQVHSLLVYYAPNSEASNIPFPISEEDMKQFIRKVKNFESNDCKQALNNLLLHRTKVNIIHEARPRLPDLVGGMETSWSFILHDYSELIPLLNIDQLTELADMILRDMLEGESSSEKWEAIFGVESLQENNRFITTMVCQALTKIGLIIEGSMSAVITSRINIREILDDDREDSPVPALDNQELIKFIPKLANLRKNNSSKIEKYLQALLYLPLKHLEIPLRTMTFVTTYVIGRECETNARIKSLTDIILSETLEEGGIKVSDFIDSASLVPNLTESKILQKVFERSIRSADPSSSLKNLIDPDECPDESVLVVLSCIENVKPRLNSAQKEELSKFEKKLSKQVLNVFGKDVKFADQTRAVTLAFKSAISQNNVKKKLKKQVTATLDSAFMDEDMKKNLTEEDRKEIVSTALELAVVALQHRGRLDLSEGLISNIWKVVLEYPEPKLLTPLLDASGPKLFSEVLAALQIQVITELRAKDTVKLNNTLTIWHCIVKTDMGAQRNKARLNITRKLVLSLEILEISSEHWPVLVKLLQAIINSKHIQLSGGFIDVIITVAAKSLREGNTLRECNEVLDLCLGLLKSRNEIMLDRLQTFLLLYRSAMTLIKREAANGSGQDENILGLCVLNLEKVTNALIKVKRHMARLSPYLLSDMVILFAEGDLLPVVKEPFKNCFNSLLSICDSHGLALISRALPAANSEIFKDMTNTYNKYHRFTGKI